MVSNSYSQILCGAIILIRSWTEGELADLIDEFSEGRVQFAYVKVTDPNTGLPKNVLIAWCGEGVPERTKGYFTSHLASVSKFLHVRDPLPPPPPKLGSNMDK